jgi:hypothetical protein
MREGVRATGKLAKTKLIETGSPNEPEQIEQKRILGTTLIVSLRGQQQ